MAIISIVANTYFILIGGQCVRGFPLNDLSIEGESNTTETGSNEKIQSTLTQSRFESVTLPSTLVEKIAAKVEEIGTSVLAKRATLASSLPPSKWRTIGSMTTAADTVRSAADNVTSASSSSPLLLESIITDKSLRNPLTTPLSVFKEFESSPKEKIQENSELKAQEMSNELSEMFEQLKAILNNRFQNLNSTQDNSKEERKEIKNGKTEDIYDILFCELNSCKWVNTDPNQKNDPWDFNESK